MPIPAIVLIGIIPEIADTITFLGLLGVIGGSVAGWCRGHSCTKRDLLYAEYVPQLNVERQDVGPCGVPSYNFDICRTELAGVHVVSSTPAPGVAQFDNIPPACMDLAVVLSGSCNGVGTHPVPCGSACMQYTGLSDAQMGSLSKSLGG